MQRVNVTGNAGSGKSTVARKIALALGLELIGLDAIVWKSGWRKTAAHERREREEAIAVRPRWVVDGVSGPIRAAADTIVFLDYPRRVSYLRCARRNWRYLFRSRPGLPPGCPEIAIVPQLVALIWRFPTAMRPRILAEMTMTSNSFSCV